MTTTQYRTIFMKDLHKYPDWNIKEKFIESAMFLPYCERSGLPIDECELKECAAEKSHKSRVTAVEKAIIYKESQTIVP